MRLLSVVWLSAAVCLIAGCGAVNEPDAASDSSIVSTVAEPSRDAAVPTTPAEASSSTTTERASGTGVPVIRSGKQSLSLADAQATNSWEEGSFDVPKMREPVQAIATNVGCYSDRTLEFRFSLESGQLNVTAAQSQDSRSSSVVLQFSLLADGRSVDVKKVAFDQQAVLTTQLDGVSVVKVHVERVDSPGSCDETTALLTSVEIV